MTHPVAAVTVRQLVIEHPPPPAQNVRERAHWSTRHRIMRDWSLLVLNAVRLDEALHGPWPTFTTATVRFRLFYATNRRRDPDGATASI